jgi:hypothetical protein
LDDALLDLGRVVMMTPLAASPVPVRATNSARVAITSAADGRKDFMAIASRIGYVADRS